MSRWVMDSDHSVAAFSIKYLLMANVRGIMGGITGAISFDPADPGGLAVQAEIDVSTVQTAVKKRDEHLLGPDFFDAARYPKITFKSTKAEHLGGNRIRVTGELTLHGVTRPVAVEGEYSGPVKLPESIGGETSLGFAGATVINREDFGMTWGDLPMNGGLMAAKEVSITLDIESDLES
ncbi:MAG: YceI family protein [Nitrospiraceae bacterium]|nr:YceI family protein [Nitrospiraceae bacterium]